ncbi:hypothetical protein Ddye_031551 [Dipteronia dyeriana]|uniref:Jacalin-type lectin domain-containing protein n=1 Tax=Dipteronia dyeriana TaxID=168575 RepID=A0AAD9TIJ3_9ROSI|nr:hypothetical protein Ddye_031551 [Dipteronia dyeriana]
MANQGTIKLGPWGGAGGVAWDFNSGSGAAIKEIVINHGAVVDSVTFTAIDRVTGEILAKAIFGGLGGQPDQISIDWPGEYLTSISGTTNVYLETLVVESITFHTNRTTYGPYGQTNGTAFEIPLENAEIVGFFGRAGAFVDAIGIHVVPSAN